MAVGGPLFGPSTTTRSQSKALVEFRCGKMSFNETTKMVSPDKRKGLLMVTQTDDQLMHLQWKDRTAGSVEDDLILMPDDVEFKAVPACTTGRVFVLKFKGNDKKMFFWMQEPKSDKDEDYCKKVNDFLNNPPAPGSASRALLALTLARPSSATRAEGSASHARVKPPGAPRSTSCGEATR